MSRNEVEEVRSLRGHAFGVGKAMSDLGGEEEMPCQPPLLINRAHHQSHIIFNSGACFRHRPPFAARFEAGNDGPHIVFVTLIIQGEGKERRILRRELMNREPTILVSSRFIPAIPPPPPSCEVPLV